MKQFREVRNKISILVFRDNKNEPYVKVYYNDQDAFNLSPINKDFANYMARRMQDRQVCYSYIDGKVIDHDNVEIDYDNNKYYCVVGSYSSKAEALSLIESIYHASHDNEVSINVFVSDGISSPVCIVRDSSSNASVDAKLKTESNIRKMLRSSQEIAKYNQEKDADYRRDMAFTNYRYEDGRIDYQEAKEDFDNMYDYYYSNTNIPFQDDNNSIVKDVVEIKGFK